MRARPWGELGERERGSASLELVIIAPAFLLLLTVLVFAGRVALAQQAVTAAAADAARAASIERTATTARTTATTAASQVLAAQGLSCSTTQVALDTAGFAAPVGLPATVTATVTCTLALADLSAPGIPGSKVIEATMTSPLDAHRERAG